jgi:DNA-directed RNA polymerase specialized sigma54-like protein
VVQRLKAHGITCARRTVAKYREALQIPTASARRNRGTA